MVAEADHEESSEEVYIGHCRNRAIAAILGYKDREVDSFLPPQIRAQLRRVILEEINEFCDEAMDLVSEHPTINQFFVDQVAAIYRVVVEGEDA